MIFKLRYILGMLFLAPLITWNGPANVKRSFSVSLIVRAHGVSLPKEELDAVLEAAKDFLTSDGVNLSFTVASDQFDSNHNVIDDGKILSCDDIKSLLNSSVANGPKVHVHIVKNIPCCDGAVQSIEGNTIVGCSDSKKPLIVRAPDNPGLVRLTAIQWMHELGHNRGLQHSACQNSIMFPVPSFESTTLDSCEQLVFNGGTTSNPVCAATPADNCYGLHPQLTPALR